MDHAFSYFKICITSKFGEKYRIIFNCITSKILKKQKKGTIWKSRKWWFLTLIWPSWLLYRHDMYRMILRQCSNLSTSRLEAEAITSSYRRSYCDNSSVLGKLLEDLPEDLILISYMFKLFFKVNCSRFSTQFREKFGEWSNFFENILQICVLCKTGLRICLLS